MRRRRIAGAAAAATALLFILLIWPVGLLTGDDDGGGSSSSSDASAAQPQVLGQLLLRPQSGEKGVGIALITETDGQRSLLVQARGLKPTQQGEAYEVWLFNSQQDATVDGRPADRQAGQLPGRRPPAGQLPGLHVPRHLARAGRPERRPQRRFGPPRAPVGHPGGFGHGYRGRRRRPRPRTRAAGARSATNPNWGCKWSVFWENPSSGWRLAYTYATRTRACGSCSGNVCTATPRSSAKAAPPTRRFAATAELEPDVVVLDFRTAVGNLDETVAAIKESHPSTAVVVHTGVPRYLIEDQVTAAGGVYSPKNEPEHLIALVGSLAPAPTEAASRDS